ncbi:dodecin domain-containing protein [Microvirga roseola]|uniref:dodecin domain-containing protein n=1 Tax=Microvirga roseola TaxID=2883126 RepID=UPI003898FD87
MALLKVIKVLAESDQSWEDAARRAVRIASQSVRRGRRNPVLSREREDLLRARSDRRVRVTGSGPMMLLRRTEAAAPCCA